MKLHVTILILIFNILFLRGEDKIFFLKNDKLKLGISLSAGGGIFYLGLVDGDNLLNCHDRGRFIQQSYYGKKDSSKWLDKKWVWNPVQSGNRLYKGAQILEFKKSPEAIYVKSIPLHWATGNLLKDCIMEQWIILKGSIAHIRYKFTYKGKEVHPEKKQELPAVYVDSKYHKLVYYGGNEPWTNKETDSLIPGWPNKSVKLSESWAAFIDENNFGLGVMSPIANQLTAYRYIEKNSSGSLSKDCSYMSPIAKISIQKKKPLVYDVFFTIGKIDSIRARFSELCKNILDE